MHAFGQKSPKDGFEELAQEVTELAGRLPLGLRVIGSYCRGMSKQEWKKSLPRLQASLDDDIQSILKFSYDALGDEDKDLFLHIACFFNGVEINKVEEHLEKKFLEVRQRLIVLAEKSLISFSWGSSIDMHSLLRKLGRDIVRKQSIHELGQHMFLVDKRDICKVLTGDTAGSKCVIGIDFNGSGEELDISERAFRRMSNLQFLRVYGVCHKLKLPEGLSYLSHKLRLLRWSHFPGTCLPCIVDLKFLVELVMDHSKLEKLWEGTKPIPNLKWMNLSYSENLEQLPDLSTAINLQELDLRNCTSLVKLPYTFEYTKNLQELNLSNCSSLIEFPFSIWNASNLENLYLHGCSNLVEFPSSIGNTTNLKKSNLKRLDLSNCSSVIKLSSSIGNATSLEYLDLSNCSNLAELPPSIGNLRKLQKLILKGCSKLEILPTNINLASLKKLDLTYFSMLKYFPEISTNIEVLMLRGTSVEEVPTSIRFWPRLDALHMTYFENLKDFSHSFDSIKPLYFSDTEIDEVPTWFKRISRLRTLVLKGCRKLVSLPQISDSLSYLDAENCESLEILNCSFHNPYISLNFAKCFKLNQEARDLIIQTPSIEYAVLPGKEVPTYFTHRASGDSLTIKLEERPLPTSMRFKACILPVNKGNEGYFCDSVSVTCRKEHFLHPVLKDHLYTFEVKTEVTSSELVFEFKFDYDWEIGECGLLQLS